MPTDTSAPRPFAKTEQALTTLHPKRMKELDEYAERNEVSRAAAIRDFIHAGLDQDKAAREEVES